MKHLVLVSLLFALALPIAGSGCQKSATEGFGSTDTEIDADTDTDTSVDSDADSDTDTDSDSDTDTDSDTDADSDTDCDDASEPEYSWCDETTGLLWENPHMDAPGGINWPSSNSYCESLSLGGFSDWRLPTIDELRTLVRECPATEPGGECEVTASCLVSDCAGPDCDGCAFLEGPASGGCYWDDAIDGLCEATVHWSSSAVEDQAGHHFGILFGSAAVLIQVDDEPDTDTDWTMSCPTIVRCVRGSL